MKKERFDEYIRRFNERDDTAFDDFLTPDMHMQNGTLEYSGVQGMKDHYAKIWQDFREELFVERFVSDDETVAIQMWTHFTALHDAPDALFGAVQEGETFDFRGVIMYRLRGEKFADIKVAYNSFTRTDLQGNTISLGIPH